MRNARTSAVVLLLAGLLALVAAGCGSSSKTTTTTPPATTTTAATATASSAPANAAAAQVVAKCKAVVNGRTGLSAGLKSKLIGICDSAGTGNAHSVKQALGQVCTQIVDQTVPGVAPKALKDEALAQCKKAFR